MEDRLMKVEYQSLSGITVKLDAQTVRDAIARGNGRISDQEIALFLRTCQARRLDPLENGETWLIKYDDKVPAQIVVGYFAYIRRADKFPDYRGFKAGITVAYKNADGSFKTDSDGMPIIKKKEGAAVYKVIGEYLIGGWCEVYREKVPGHVETSYMEVTLDEYSTGKSNWTAKPATMVRKVSVSQAFRQAFPNEYEGLYTEDEMIASGAIPADGYTVVDDSTGEVVEDKKITQEQRQNLFRTARQNLGANADDILRQILDKHGYESTANMPNSVYAVVMTEIIEAANESRPECEADGAKQEPDGDEAEQEPE